VGAGSSATDMPIVSTPLRGHCFSPFRQTLRASDRRPAHLGTPAAQLPFFRSLSSEFLSQHSMYRGVTGEYSLSCPNFYKNLNNQNTWTLLSPIISSPTHLHRSSLSKATSRGSPSSQQVQSGLLSPGEVRSRPFVLVEAVEDRP
jgi:hypothetical protein